MNWWLPHKFDQKRGNLKVRGQVVRAIRALFDGQGFEEVETPILQVCPVMDAHIRAFGTDLRGVDGEIATRMYLHTSPEFAMKKLMVAGVENLYQICHVFRNAEDSKRHSPEFTMIEWYRTQADYTDIMADCEGLLREVATACGIKAYNYKDQSCDPFTDFERLTVCEAFERYAGIDLTEFLPPHPTSPLAQSPSPRRGEGSERSEQGEGAYIQNFRKAVSALDLHTAADDGWDDLFFRVMDDKIEPHLGMKRPTFLCDYPISMASLSKPKEDDPRFAERFELYVCGIELANAFSELTDVDIQKTRFAEELGIKEKLYGERYPVDEDFLNALAHGLPESGGIALGIDRLVMLACGAEDIDDVLWAPV